MHCCLRADGQLEVSYIAIETSGSWVYCSLSKAQVLKASHLVIFYWATLWLFHTEEKWKWIFPDGSRYFLDLFLLLLGTNQALKAHLHVKENTPTPCLKSHLLGSLQIYPCFFNARALSLRVKVKEKARWLEVISLQLILLISAINGPLKSVHTWRNVCVSDDFTPV